MSTRLGLLRAQDFVDQTLQNNLNSQQFLATRMNFLAQTALENQKMALEYGKPDPSVTDRINDGYLHTAYGQTVLDANGNPVKSQRQMTDQEKMNAQFAQAKELKQMELNQGHYVSNGMGGVLDTRTGAISYGDNMGNSMGNNSGSNTGLGIITQNGQLDFRSLASQYPNEASIKNNNPAGITWNSNFDK
jgi:hypothetical protein